MIEQSERRKKYERPRLTAIEIQTEAFIATSGIEVQSDFGQGEGNDGYTPLGD